MGRDPITPRRLEVVRLVAQGLDNANAAHVLGVAEGTFKSHVVTAMALLSLRKRSALASWYVLSLSGPELEDFRAEFETLHEVVAG